MAVGIEIANGVSGSIVPDETLNTTPLTAAHRGLGGKLVPFAGYAMPVQYPLGILKEHLWTRQHAGLFDVSHMGLATLALDAPSGDPDADFAVLARAFEGLAPSDIAGLRPGRQRYTLLLNAGGGIIDDLILSRPSVALGQGHLRLVVNAATQAGDFALIQHALAGLATLNPLRDHVLLALQGPDAAEVLAPLAAGAAELGFMQTADLRFESSPLTVCRSGYTGEDGFELLAPEAAGARLWERLNEDPRVRPIGLGARDSLRLEAGLPLFGRDLDATISPVEARLTFVLSQRRLAAADFPGARRILAELERGPARLRIGLEVQGAPAREGARIRTPLGEGVGVVTSGGFSPSLSAPIAMGFVLPAYAVPGVELTVEVRGKAQPARVVPLPFIPHRYVRRSA